MIPSAGEQALVSAGAARGRSMAFKNPPCLGNSSFVKPSVFRQRLPLSAVHLQGLTATPNSFTKAQAQMASGESWRARCCKSPLSLAD